MYKQNALNVGGMLAVDEEKRLAVCQFCGEPFVVQEAVNNYNTYNTTNNNYNTTHNYGDGTTVNVYEDTNKDFVIEVGVLKEYHGASVDVVIPDGVVEIQNECFKYLKIKSVIIPDSVTSIGYGAFSNCKSLISIKVDDNNNIYASDNGVLFNKDKTILIKYPIGKSDTEYNILDSVTSIDISAFGDCTSLTSVTIPDKVTSIGNYAFYGCTSLASVTIPDKVTSIGNYAFYGCTSLASVIIPESVTSIGNDAFKNCTNLYYKNKDLLNVNCTDFETISIAKSMGIVPIIKHELVECKCARCHKYFLESCKKEEIHCGGYNSFSVYLVFINDKSVIFSNDSIYDIWSLYGSYRIDEFWGGIRSSLKEKLAGIETLILLNLNKNNRKYCETFGLNKYSDSMKNLFTVLFPNVSNIKIEEDTGYYDDIQEKQISLLNDLVFPFIDEKLKKNSVRVSWNKNLPTDFINSISKALAKRKEKNEEAEKQRIIAERKSKGLCQHCGGTFKGLFSSKCSICGKLKDY